MKLQVLLSAMNQTDRSIVTRANLQTDAIIINQADSFKKDVFKHKGSTIQLLTFDERGVGLSRNNALMRSTADVVIFGDEDIRYVDGYEKLILNEFRKNPKADMIVFNVPSDNPERPTYQIRKMSRVRKYNSLRYGAVKMAVRTQSIKKNNISFSLLFGGGAKYSSGEDSLLIYSILKSRMKVYACPITIGFVSQDDSTWFKGYTEKFFHDKGALFASLSPKFSWLLILQFAVRKYKSFNSDLSIIKVAQLMGEGASEIKSGIDKVRHSL